ncbi:MAG: hypothetical protein ACLPX7_11055, partial [Xanthobacteraceae bacterium]
MKDDRHMKLFCDSTRPFARLQPAPRLRLLLLSFAAPALWVVICLVLFSSSVQATFTPNSSRDHVYLFRGLVPVLSSGMGEIAARLRKQGIN